MVTRSLRFLRATKHLTDELHREIFEGKRRTVKKFQKKMVIFKLDQRARAEWPKFL